jgi:hypothetical protein
MTSIIHVGFEEEKVAKQPRRTTADIIRQRIEPIKDKDAQKVFEKLLAHVDRKENVEIDIQEKEQEIRELQEHVKTLSSEYDKSFDRNVMKASVEVEGEIELIKQEVLALRRKANSPNNWIVEISEIEAETVEMAYAPLGKKEQKLYQDLVKVKDEFVKAYVLFKNEHDSNVNLHNTIIGLFANEAHKFVKLNHVTEYEISKIMHEVNKI